jgi:hypothetical protein
VTPGVHGCGNATSRPSPTATPRPAPKRERAKPRPERVPAPTAAAAPATGGYAPYSAGATDEWPEPAGDQLAGDPAVSTAPPGSKGPVAEFNVASFNILGSSHTEKGGHHSWLASGPQRIGGVLQILGQHDVSVVGMQEFQTNQRQAFRSRATGWQMYPGLSMGSRAGENSVAWRTNTWDLVKAATVPIPYFNGRERPMPYVLLRHKATGVRAYFSTFHNPADTRKFRGQQRFRDAATDREIALFNRLESEGIPQFVTGDMNERSEYYCRVTARTALEAAAGGSNAGSCKAPRPTPIDWIFGSPGVAFSGYKVDRSPLVRRTTDHPVMIAHAKVDPARFANATAGR